MGDLTDEYFNMTNYVPKFSLKPQVTNYSEHIHTIQDLRKENTYIDDVLEFTRQSEEYGRPRIHPPSENINKWKEPSCKVHDNLVDILIKDHGWKLEDFDILKNKANALINTENGVDLGDGIGIQEHPFDNLKTTRKTIGPAYNNEERQSKLNSGHGNKLSFKGRILKLPDMKSETKYREEYWSSESGVTEYDTHYGPKSIRSTKYLQSYFGFFQRYLSHNYVNQCQNHESSESKKNSEYKFEENWEDFQRNSLGANNLSSLRTKEESETNQMKSETVKSTNMPNGHINETNKNNSYLTNGDVEYSVDKCFELLLKAGYITNGTTPIEISQNSIIQTSKNLNLQKDYIPCKGNLLEYKNTITNEPISNVFHRTNSHVVMNNKPSAKPTITNSLIARRGKLRAHNWPHSIRNNVGITNQTNMIERSTSSNPPERHCKGKPNQELNSRKTDAQIDQQRFLAIEHLYKIIKFVKQSKENSMKSLPKTTNNENDASQLVDFDPKTVNDTNSVESVEQNGAQLASLTNKLTRAYTELFRKEPPKQKFKLLPSSPLSFIVSEGSSTPPENTHNLITETNDKLPLESQIKHTKVEQTIIESTSNTVEYNKDLESNNTELQSTYKEIELDEWALKYQLLSAIHQMNNFKSESYDNSNKNASSNQLRVSRNQRIYKHDIRLEPNISPRMQPDSNIYKNTVRYPSSMKRTHYQGPFINQTKYHNMFGFARYKHRISNTKPYVKSQMQYSTKHHATNQNYNKGFLFKNTHYRTSNYRNRNPENVNANFQKSFPGDKKLWHTHRIRT